MNAKVAIILVNYNGYEDTLECVQSILNISYNNYDILIVDNASTETHKIEKDIFLQQNTKIIVCEENLGFSGGNNLAIRMALQEQYDYVLLLNNDTTVAPDFLNELVNSIEHDNSYGIAVGKIYFYHDRNKVWFAGGEYDRKTGLTLQCGGADSSEWNVVKDISFATGCMMLIPISVIEKVGELDEFFFLYSEDTDYCQRVIDAGYKIKYVPSSIIYHKVSSSIGSSSYRQQRYMMRNNLYMIERYCNNSIMAHANMMFQMIKYIIKGECHIVPTIQGYRDFCQKKSGRIE